MILKTLEITKYIFIVAIIVIGIYQIFTSENGFIKSVKKNLFVYEPKSFRRIFSLFIFIMIVFSVMYEAIVIFPTIVIVIPFYYTDVAIINNEPHFKTSLIGFFIFIVLLLVCILIFFIFVKFLGYEETMELIDRIMAPEFFVKWIRELKS